MVRPDHEDGFPGDHDVPASFAHAAVDGEGYRVALERSVN
jgi:hypothetical protein